MSGLAAGSDVGRLRGPFLMDKEEIEAQRRRGLVMHAKSGEPAPVKYDPRALQEAAEMIEELKRRYGVDTGLEALRRLLAEAPDVR